MFFKLYDDDSSNYVSKTEFNTTTANLQSQITAADTKIDNVNTNLTTTINGVKDDLQTEITDREAAITAVNNTIDNITAALPTDIVGSGNTIYLVHNGTKLTPQTDVEFKTVNGNSIIGSGDIAISGGGGSTFTLLENLTASAGVSDTTYTDYPLRFDFTVADLTANDMVEAVLSVADATTGNFAPITVSAAGKFSIYGKTGSSLSSSINAIVFKGGNN